MQGTFSLGLVLHFIGVGIILAKWRIPFTVKNVLGVFFYFVVVHTILVILLIYNPDIYTPVADE